MPIWIWVVIIGILVSGYMTLRTMQEEQQDVAEIIEQEGEVIMARIEEKRKAQAEG